MDSPAPDFTNPIPDTIYPAGLPVTAATSDLERVARQTVAMLASEGYRAPFCIIGDEFIGDIGIADAEHTLLADYFPGTGDHIRAHALCALLNALPWHEAA